MAQNTGTGDYSRRIILDDLYLIIDKNRLIQCAWAAWKVGTNELVEERFVRFVDPLGPLIGSASGQIRNSIRDDLIMLVDNQSSLVKRRASDMFQTLFR